jgi:pimeloyl-ACP methyl ester carboxylesterase
VVGDIATYVGLRLGAPWWRRRGLADLTAHLDPSDVDGARQELDAQFGRPLWRTFLVEQRALVRQLPLLDGALSTVDCQVRVVAGTEDTVIPRRTVETLGQRLSGARVSWVDGGGHDLPLHSPAPVAAAIEELL